MFFNLEDVLGILKIIVVTIVQTIVSLSMIFFGGIISWKIWWLPDGTSALSIAYAETFQHPILLLIAYCVPLGVLVQGLHLQYRVVITVVKGMRDQG